MVRTTILDAGPWGPGGMFYRGSSTSTSMSRSTGGALEPRANILQRATLDAIRQRTALGEQQTAAGLMRGTARGMARSGQTAGELAQISQDVSRDVFALQRNLQDQLARLQGEAEERAEARASATQFGGYKGPGYEEDGERTQRHEMGTRFIYPRTRGSQSQPGQNQQGFYSTRTRQWFPTRTAARTAEVARRTQQSGSLFGQGGGQTGTRTFNWFPSTLRRAEQATGMPNIFNF